MNEGQFNAELRAQLRAGGLQAIHIRETDGPGVVDLLVWEGDDIIAWMELKVDDEALRPSQIEFLRSVENGMVARLFTDTGKTLVYRIDDATGEPDEILAVVPDFKEWPWVHELKRWAVSRAVGI